MKLVIKPQEGPQTVFLETFSDIAIYGGAAGSGKSYSLLLEPVRHYNNPQFGGVIFRRTTPQIRNEGGLWHESEKIYAPLLATPRESVLEWRFPKGMRMKFAHLEYDKSVFDFQGSQIPFIGFDELTHFSEKQFWYMLSRNRSTSGVPGYVRCTTNPDADSWVRKLIDWWIGPEGYAIPERSGVVRWFIRDDETLVWADTKEELIERFGKEQIPKSLTFVSASIFDNRILLEKDPSYLSNLRALPRVERERLLGGNWNIKPQAGNVFRREWFPIIDAVPAGWIAAVRYWDKAATKKREGTAHDPDWTAGPKLLKYPDNTFVLADVRRTRDTPLQIERMIKNTADFDGHGTTVCIEQEPGSSGVADAGNYTRLLSGYDVRIRKPTTDKLTRAKPVSAQCEAGNVKVLKAPWNEDFFLELENFPDGKHDDQVDGFSGAFNELAGSISILDVL